MNGLALPFWLLLCLAELAAVWGFWLLGAWFARRMLLRRGEPAAPLPAHGLDLLTTGLGWALGLGAQGIIASLCYYLGSPPQTAILTGGLAGAGLAVLLRRHWRLALPSAPFRNLTRPALFCLGLFCCGLLIHLARVPLPWYDQDELTVYGFLARMIAQGWTFAEVARVWKGCVHYGPKLVECLDAQLILLSGDIWLVRLSRLVGLAASALVCAGTLGMLGAPRAFCWAVATAVLTTPELMMYLGVSLKVDSAVMLFDTGAVCVLVLAWLAALPIRARAGADADPTRLETALRRAELAFILALAAAAGRQSGLYAAFLCGLSIVFFAWPWRADAPRIPWGRLGLLTLAALVAGIGYWANWAVFGNPIYPFMAPWPLADAPHITSIEKYRQHMNLLGPKGLVQLYLIPHLALGLEFRNMPFPPYAPFPHAVASRGQAMGWLSPTLLAILLWPFALRLRPALVLGGVFLAQYLIWCQGVYYSRLFLGSSLLMTMLCGYLAWAESQPGHRPGALVRRAALALLCATLALTLPLGLRWSWLRFEGNPALWLSSQGRYEYTAKTLSGFSAGLSMPARQEAAAMDTVLGDIPKPVVAVQSRAGNGIHALFARGFFVDGKLEPAPDILLLGPDNAGHPVPEGLRLAYASPGDAWRLFVRDVPAARAAPSP